MNSILFLNNSAYGTYHLICLVVCIAAIVSACIFLKNLKFDKALTFLILIGITSELLKVCSYIVKNEPELGGYLPKTDLPFHLCSIQIIFMILIKLSKNESLKRVLLCFMLPTCLVGGAAALFIPTSSSLNMPVVTVQYFMFHSAIVWFAIYLLEQKDFKLTLKDYRNTLLMLLATFFVAIYLNSWVRGEGANVNFMYVVNPPTSGLPLLNKNHGWLPYIIHYAFIGFVGVSCFYIRPFIEYFKQKKNE